MIFAVSGPWLTDGTADCSGLCGPIRLKFYVVNRLGYGYKQCKFCRGALRYASAAVENRQKPMLFAVSGPGLTVFDGFSTDALAYLVAPLRNLHCL